MLSIGGNEMEREGKMRVGTQQSTLAMCCYRVTLLMGSTNIRNEVVCVWSQEVHKGSDEKEGRGRRPRGEEKNVRGNSGAISVCLSER